MESTPLTMDRSALDDSQTELFTIEIQTSILTAEGNEIHILRVSDVVSFSCLCLQCGKDVPTTSLLESHKKTHLTINENRPSQHAEAAGWVPVNIVVAEGKDEHGDVSVTDTDIADNDTTMDDRPVDGVRHTGHSEAGTTNENHHRPDGRLSTAEGICTITGPSQTTESSTKKTESRPGRCERKCPPKVKQNPPKRLVQTRSAKKVKSEPTCQSVKGNHKLTKKGRRPPRRKILEGGLFMEEDSKGKPYVCTRCGKRFSRGCELSSHIRWHAREEPKCMECGKQFAHLNELQNHILIHTGEKRHSCTICGRHFRLKSQVGSHMITHSDAKPYKCEVCGKSFSRKRLVKQHSYVHSKLRSFVCSFCGKACKRSNTLKEHVKIAHEGKHYTCEVCGQVLRAYSSYKSHFRIHTDERPHMCSECGKRFSRKCDLDSHIRTHTGDKRYSCSTCGKKFNQKYYLEEHVRLHTGEKPFTCTHCGVTFRIRAALRRHLLKDHQEMDQSKEGATSDVNQFDNPPNSDIELTVITLSTELSNMSSVKAEDL